MRHIRDPITGYCIICEKNNIRHFVAPNELDDAASSVGRPSRAGRPGKNDPQGKKTIYVSAYPNRSPSPRRPDSSSSSSSDSASVNSAGKSTMISSRSTSKLVLVDRRSPSPSVRGPNPGRSPSPVATQGKRGMSPTPKGSQKSRDLERGCCFKKRGTSPTARGRSPSPDVKRGCCKKTGRGSKTFDGRSPYEDRCCGYRDFETASFGAGTWGIRRWCAPLIILLVLMALAGLAVGIYFGVKAVNAKKQQNQKIANYIKSAQIRYIIVGVDQPCNSFNNNSKTGTTPRPNCNAITTRIVAATRNFVAPTDPDWVLALTVSGAPGRSLVLSLTSLGDVGMLVWVVGGFVWTTLASLGSGVYG